MKYFLPLLLSILLCLSACNSSDHTAAQENNVSSQQEIPSKNKIKDQSAPLQAAQDTGFSTINIGDSITLDFAALTFDAASWSDTIMPTDTSGFYSYMSDIDGESYFWLRGTLKNTAGSAYNVSNMVAKITFDEKYTYNAWLIAEDDGTDFYGYLVNPLSSVTYYIYSSIPDELKTMYSSCQVRFGFSETFSGSSYDSFEECSYRYVMSLSK